MAEPLDCAGARALIQRLVTGAAVTEGELERARDHLSGCEECRTVFEVAGTRSLEGAEEIPADADSVFEEAAGPEEIRDVAEAEAEPSEVEARELFERLHVAALEDHGIEPIGRARVAERLGRAERLGPVALAALAEAAREDPDEGVREAALAALDRLDEAVSIPQRVIEAWSEAPAAATPFIEGVLERLTDEPPSARGVLGLARATGGRETELRGKEASSGLLQEKEGNLWLSLKRLPAEFENTKPVVVVPRALAEGTAAVDWSGEQPGLVRAETPVAGNSLEVRLGEVTAPVREERLFGRIYVLNPKASRETHRSS